MSELKKLAPGMSLGFKGAVNMILVTVLICTGVIVSAVAAFYDSLEQSLLEDARNVTRATASVISESHQDPDSASRKLAEIRNYYRVDEMSVFVPQVDQVLCHYLYIKGEPELRSEEGLPMRYDEAGLADIRDSLLAEEKPDSFLLGSSACGLAPIQDEQGNPAGFVLLGLSTQDIAAQRRAYARRLAGIELILCIVLGGLSALVTHHVIIRPINRLAEATQDFVQLQRSGGEMDARMLSALRMKRKDEIGRLGAYICQMEQELRSYIRELTEVTAEKERIGTELNVATQIQASMLPTIFPPFPDRQEFDIRASMDPAKEVGGDFYDFFLVDEDHLAMVIADVSGKGVPAALFMVIAKTLLKTAAQQGLTPGQVLDRVNNQLCEGNEAEMFVTAWLGILELSTGRMVCANAGHEYPAISHEDGSFTLYRDRHGLVLAGMPGSRYREYTLNLKPNDCLFVYTDGVPEAINDEEELYGTDRMLDSLNRADRRAKELGQFLPLVRADIDEFTEGTKQFDDITMLVLRYKGK